MRKSINYALKIAALAAVIASLSILLAPPAPPQPGTSASTSTARGAAAFSADSDGDGAERAPSAHRRPAGERLFPLRNGLRKRGAAADRRIARVRWVRTDPAEPPVPRLDQDRLRRADPPRRPRLRLQPEILPRPRRNAAGPPRAEERKRGTGRRPVRRGGGARAGRTGAPGIVPLFPCVAAGRPGALCRGDPPPEGGAGDQSERADNRGGAPPGGGRPGLRAEGLRSFPRSRADGGEEAAGRSDRRARRRLGARLQVRRHRRRGRERPGRTTDRERLEDEGRGGARVRRLPRSDPLPARDARDHLTQRVRAPI